VLGGVRRAVLVGGGTVVVVAGGGFDGSGGCTVVVVTGGSFGGSGGWTIAVATGGVTGGVGGCTDGVTTGDVVTAVTVVVVGTTGGSCRGDTSTTTAEVGGVGGFTVTGGWVTAGPGPTVVGSRGGVVRPTSVEAVGGFVVRSATPGHSSKRTTA
jgi:hypothetical protein